MHHGPSHSMSPSMSSGMWMAPLPLNPFIWSLDVCFTVWIEEFLAALLSPIEHRSWRGDAPKCIDRIFSGARNVQQQEAPHNAEVFVKVLHAGESIRAFHCPIAMLNERSSRQLSP